MYNVFKYNFIYRWIVIVWLAIKFIIKIYFFLFTHSVWDRQTNEKWEKMLSNLAKEYRIKAERLGGLLIKVGQFLSTRTDFMPDVFISELTELVDHVPAMPFEYAESVLKEEWGGSVYKPLKAINKQSIASASIGEVYFGILKDGTEVAIKVRRHRIDEIFHKDFVALRMVFWIVGVFTNFGKKTDLKSLYHELVRVMSRELDYNEERSFGEYFRERYEDYEGIHIPRFYEEWCTERVIVMEWVEGVKITDINFMKQNHLDISQISKTLFDFYLDQFLNPGKFHADPHPGNVLINRHGMITIIDFGMIGEIKKEDTEYFKLLVQGFIIDNYDIVIDALDKMNFLLPHADKKKIKETLIDVVEMYSDGSLKKLNNQTLDQLLDEINTIMKEEAIQLPADYAYLLRAISIVVGTVFAIYPDVDIVKWAKPNIQAWFGKRDIAESVAKQYIKNAADPLLSYPRALLNFLERGEHDRRWDQQKTYLKMKHQYYLLLEVISFMMIVIGVIIGLSSYSFNHPALGKAGIIIVSLFLIALNLILLFHRRMIRMQKKKGV